MSLSLHLHNTATKLAMWATQHSAATRFMMMALPVTFAVTAVILRIPTPPTGCSTGGSGGC